MLASLKHHFTSEDSVVGTAKLLIHETVEQRIHRASEKHRGLAEHVNGFTEDLGPVNHAGDCAGEVT